MTVRVKVKKAKYGKGLFANQDIKFTKLVRDRPVIISFEAKTKGQKRWDEHVEKFGIPFDSGLKKYDKYLYDPTFTDPKNPPNWYRLNHSFFPNAIMKVRGTTVVWLPLKDIKKGEEITFHYGDPDESWDKSV